MHCSKEKKPQFVPPPLRSRHQGRQVAVWASTGAASIIGTSAVRESATKKERVNLVFRIKIRIDNPEGILKPGLPADADVG